MARRSAALERVALAGFVALVVAAAIRLPPIQDEAYYWTWSRALAFRYFDHPPAIAWLIALATKVFGHGIVAVRSIALVSMVVTAVFVVMTTRRCVDPVDPVERTDATRLALLILGGAPMFVIGFIPATPDPVHGAITAVAAYCVVRACDADAKPRWSFAAAFLLVAAIGVKHYAAFIAVGTLVGVLASRRDRRVLAHWAPWAGVVAAMVLLVPWVYTELTADLSSAGFQLDKVVHGRPSRGLVAVPLTVGSLLGTFGPMTALVLLVVLARPRAWPPLVGGAIGLLLACVVAVWLGSGEANWPMPALIFGAPALVAWVVRRPRLRLAMQGVQVVSVVLMAVALAHVIHPFLPARASKDPTARGASFDRIALATSEVASEHGATIVATRRYQNASLLRYHLRDRLDVLELGSRRGRKSQYDLWPRPTACRGDTIVVATGSATIPADVFGKPVAAARVVERRHGSQPLGRWYITPVRLDRPLFDLGQRCAMQVGLTH